MQNELTRFLANCTEGVTPFAAFAEKFLLAHGYRLGPESLASVRAMLSEMDLVAGDRVFRVPGGAVHSILGRTS